MYMYLGQVGSSSPKSESCGWRWSVQGAKNWQAEKEMLEENGDQSDLRWRGFHKKASKVWKIHQTNGFEVQKGPCDSPWT